MWNGSIHCAEDARRLARRRLPWMVFDYIDGAAGSETGARCNRAALDAIKLQPRILCDVSQRSLATKVFGGPADRPFGIAPMGMCNLSAPGADLMLARLAARFRVPPRSIDPGVDTDGRDHRGRRGPCLVPAILQR